jgi:hypothetical protein
MDMVHHSTLRDVLLTQQAIARQIRAQGGH